MVSRSWPSWASPSRSSTAVTSARLRDRIQSRHEAHDGPVELATNEPPVPGPSPGPSWGRETAVNSGQSRCPADNDNGRSTEVPVAGLGPAGDHRGSTPVLTGHVRGTRRFGWGRVQTRDGEGGAAVGGHPQGGPGQAPVAPLVPDEMPQPCPADDPGPADPLHAVQRQVALPGDAGRVAPDRQQPPARILHRHPHGQPEMTAWPLAVLHPALDGGRLAAVGAAILLGPDQPPLIGPAGRQAAVPNRRLGSPQLLEGL